MRKWKLVIESKEKSSTVFFLLLGNEECGGRVAQRKKEVREPGCQCNEAKYLSTMKKKKKLKTNKK